MLCALAAASAARAADAGTMRGTIRVFEKPLLGGTKGSGDRTRAELGAELELCQIDTIRVAARAAPIRVFELLGEKGRVAADHLAARDRCESALAAYRARDFARAAALLGPCALRERALCYAACAPTADWAGVFDAPKE